MLRRLIGIGARGLVALALAAFCTFCSPLALADQYPSFLSALAQRESSNRPGIENQYGFLGLYQMGEPALIDAGFYRADGTRANDWRGNWTGAGGVNSKAQFLANPAAQTVAVTAYHRRVWASINALGLAGFTGQTIGGILITDSGLLAASHLVGPGAVANFLRSNGASVATDANGTAVTQYLRMFGGYDISSLTGRANTAGRPDAQTPQGDASQGAGSPRPSASPLGSVLIVLILVVSLMLFFKVSVLLKLVLWALPNSLVDDDQRT